MNIVRAIFAGPTSRRPHQVFGALALLVLWAFFGTDRQVMHTGSMLEMLVILGGTDAAFCLYLWARHETRRISAAARPAKSESEQDEMEKAA